MASFCAVFRSLLILYCLKTSAISVKINFDDSLLPVKDAGDLAIDANFPEAEVLLKDDVTFDPAIDAHLANANEDYFTNYLAIDSNFPDTDQLLDADYTDFINMNMTINEYLAIDANFLDTDQLLDADYTDFINMNMTINDPDAVESYKDTESILNAVSELFADLHQFSYYEVCVFDFFN